MSQRDYSANSWYSIQQYQQTQMVARPDDSFLLSFSHRVWSYQAVSALDYVEFSSNGASVVNYFSRWQ